MAEEKETKEKKPEQKTSNVVLKRFEKDQARKDKSRKWEPVEDAISVARRAYMGSFEPDGKEKTINLDKAINDLIEVLQKLRNGEIKLGGMGEEKIEFPPKV